MEALLSGPLQDVSLDDVWRVLWTLLRICFTALLFYSLFDNALFGKRLTWKYRDAVWPPATLLVITGLLLLAYAAYGVVQFRYLFGGRLPEGATYSLYAREGFFQLITVMCINITLFGLTLRYAKPSRAGLVMQILLLVSTGLLLSSAVIRLLLYISAYGLTMLRILPLWFMAYLAALLVLCSVRLKKTSLPLLRVGGRSICYKGDAAEELSLSRSACHLLHCSLESVDVTRDYGARTLVLATKQAATPALYPRKAGTPQKKPL